MTKQIKFTEEVCKILNKKYGIRPGVAWLRRKLRIACKKIDNLQAENANLKRKLKKCVCPNCGYGFEQKEE